MKQFSLAVVIYMFVGISWWGVLLYSKNQAYYRLRLAQHAPTTEEYSILEKERDRQSAMVIGEGIVLGLSLLAGIWIIYRSGLRQIQAVNSQNNFLLSVSHELKSPIASIKLALQTLQKRRLAHEDRTEVTRKAVKDADRLENLVQNILLSAGVDNGLFELYLETTEFNESINRIIDKYEGDSSYDQIRDHLESTSGIVVESDRQAIELALSNILDNAFKYSNDGSSIDIRTIDAGPNIVVRIADRGIGIPADEMDKVFDRFWRSTSTHVRTRKGTGLGLYLSRVIIEAHNGRIRVFSNNPEDGVTFEVCLPKAQK